MLGIALVVAIGFLVTVLLSCFCLQTPQWRQDEDSKETLDSDVDEQENGSGSGSSSASPSSWNFSKTYLGSMLQSLTGNKVLEADDLQPVLDTMKQNLMAKNVAAEIAEDICLSVRNSLEGKKLASMTRYAHLRPPEDKLSGQTLM